MTAISPAITVQIRGHDKVLEPYRQAGRASPRLRVALKADIDGGLLPQILTAYSAEGAALAAELVLGGHGEQALRDGRADVGLLISPFNDHDLDAEPLLTEPLLVAVAATDPLATLPRLCLADLADRRLPGGSLAYHGRPAAPLGSDATRDRQPDLATERMPPDGAARAASNLAEIFSLVETGSAVFFVPASLARRYPRPGIAYQPVTDLPDTTLVIAWPRDTHSLAVAAFVRAAGTVAATAQTGTATQKAAT